MSNRRKCTNVTKCTNGNITIELIGYYNLSSNKPFIKSIIHVIKDTIYGILSDKIYYIENSRKKFVKF